MEQRRIVFKDQNPVIAYPPYCQGVMKRIPYVVTSGVKSAVRRIYSLGKEQVITSHQRLSEIDADRRMFEPVVGGVHPVFLKRNTKVRDSIVGNGVGDLD
jgi:hypothetical protein